MRKHLGRLLISKMNSSIRDDAAWLWSWFSSVQAATHKEHGDRVRTAHDSRWSPRFWLAASRPLLGFLLALFSFFVL